MPIISISRLSADNDTWFGEHGGKLLNRKSGKETPFIKKSGVYFMRLAIPRKKNDEDANGLGFAWPGM